MDRQRMETQRMIQEIVAMTMNQIQEVNPIQRNFFFFFNQITSHTGSNPRQGDALTQHPREKEKQKTKEILSTRYSPACPHGHSYLLTHCHPLTTSHQPPATPSSWPPVGRYHRARMPTNPATLGAIWPPVLQSLGRYATQSCNLQGRMPPSAATYRPYEARGLPLP